MNLARDPQFKAELFNSDPVCTKRQKVVEYFRQELKDRGPTQ